MRVSGAQEQRAMRAMAEAYLRAIEDYCAGPLAEIDSPRDWHVNLGFCALQAVMTAQAFRDGCTVNDLIESAARVLGHLLAQAPAHHRQPLVDFALQAIGGQMAITDRAFAAKQAIN